MEAEAKRTLLNNKATTKTLAAFRQLDTFISSPSQFVTKRNGRIKLKLILGQTANFWGKLTF